MRDGQRTSARISGWIGPGTDRESPPYDKPWNPNPNHFKSTRTISPYPSFGTSMMTFPFACLKLNFPL